MKLPAAPLRGKPGFHPMTRSLLPLFALAASLAAQEPIRQASEARLWLKVPAGQAPLRDIRVSNGSATPASWEKDPAVRERHTDIVFPIRWWSWSEITIAFTPAHDGPVEWVLSGPWAPEKNGLMPRQEILWDDLSAEGTILQNGGFELTADKRPASWQASWAAYPGADAWPLAHTEALAGKNVAASWHNRPLAQTLQVKAGQQVTLKLHAKAATPPGFTPPKRLGNDTPAHRAMGRLKRGVNLANCWEAPPPYSWGIRFTPADIDRIAAEGFDHVRVPVAWHFHLQPGKTGLEISPTLLADLEPVLRRALDKNLHVMMDWHHFNDLTTAPADHLGTFLAGWEAIARHFKSWPPELFFELLNEPYAALTTEVANPIYQKSIAAIRKIDPNRIIVVSPGQWGQVGELDKLRLPDADERLIVTIHCYEPFQFTHQGAGWAGLKDLRGITYPGPPPTPYQLPASLRENAGVRSFIDGYNTLPAAQNPCSPRAIRETLDAARAWSLYFGRPIHLGEFGSHKVGDHASRARHLLDVRTLAEARQIPWTLWDWKASFAYWDPARNRPLFHSSLFP
jgi:endoglucanase